MKLTIRPTDKFMTVADNTHCRIWLARLPSGRDAHLLIAAVGLLPGDEHLMAELHPTAPGCFTEDAYVESVTPEPERN